MKLAPRGPLIGKFWLDPEQDGLHGLAVVVALSQTPVALLQRDL